MEGIFSEMPFYLFGTYLYFYKNSEMLFLFGLGFIEIAVLIGAVLLLFGGPKFKEIIKTFSEGYKEVNDIKSEIKKEVGDNIKDLMK